MDIPFEGAMEQEFAAPKPSLRLRKAIKYLVYGGIFLIPLWFLPITADAVEFNKQVILFLAAGIGMVLFLVDMIKEGALRYKPSILYWSVLGILGGAVVATIASVDRYTSLFGSGTSRSASLLTWVALAFLFFLAVQITEDRGKQLRAVLTTSITLSLLIAALQALGLSIFSGSTYGVASFNTIGSLNTLGFATAAALPLFLMSWESPSRSMTMIMTIIRYFGLTLAFFFLILINWGPVWTVTFITLGSYILFATFAGQQVKSMKVYAIPLAIVVIGAFLWLSHFDWTALRSKFPVEVSPTHRTSYNIGFAALKSRLFGYGLENYVVAYDALRPDASVNNIFFQARFTDATSEFTTMLAEGGLMMLLAFLGFIGLFVWSLFQDFRHRFDNNGERVKILASSLALLLTFFFYPMTISLLLMLFTYLALSVVSSDRTQERTINLEARSVHSLMGSGAFVVGLVLVLVSGYYLINQYISNVEYARAQSASDPDQKISKLVAGINAYPQDTRLYRTLTQTLLTQIAADVKTLTSQKTTAEFNSRLQNRVASVINVAQRSTDIDPSDSENWLNRGFVYQNLMVLVQGSDQFAIDMYTQTIKRSPANALAYVRLGNVHLTLADNAPKGTSAETVKGHLVEAERDFKKAVSLYNNYGQALYNLAAVYDRMGELPSAIKQFERLQAANPRDPSLLFQLGLLYYRNNQKPQAIQAWEKAVAGFSDYSNARWYLSLAYEEQNNLDKALEEVKAIEKVNPDNQLVKDRIAKLEANVRVIPPSTVLEQPPLNNAQ